MNDQSVGIVETKFFTFCEPPQEFVLKNGGKLGPLTLAYETYGQLNSERSNAVLILHALTGDAHAAGFHEGDTKPGWWDNMIGPGKAFDTNKYFVICSNVLGGCRGSTGPSSINPKTGKEYGLDFPVLTLQDMVKAQKYLIEHLGIKKLLATAGGSMGGMQTLIWAVLFPEIVHSSIIISTNAKHTAQQIAFHVVARQAIMSDPDWQNGNYYGKSKPSRGLALARMIGHITYMSDHSMQDKFGRNQISQEKVGHDFSSDFEVESYLKYRGGSFVNRFDANSWLYISKAVDYFDLAEDKDLQTALSNVKSEFLVISFSSDWLYPPSQTKQIVRALRANNADVTDVEINASYGHDAFLVEVTNQSKIIKHFLEKAARTYSLKA
jgi:homoserine O-acetyltransferase